MKKSFTMLELIFVIMIISILTAIVIPNTRANSLEEAAIQLRTHLRYTQHLSFINDTYDATDDEWYKKRWQLVFYEGADADNKVAYTIFSDKAGSSTGNPQETEIALNPLNRKQRMTGGYSGANALDIRHTSFVGMKELNIGQKYGVISKRLGGGCSNSRISFDYLGRPLKGDHDTMTSPYNSGSSQRLITTNCTITLRDATESIVIRIVPETGFVCVLNDDNTECR